MAHLFADSAQTYPQWRRRRVWAQAHPQLGAYGYQAFGPYFAAPELGPIIGAEVAATSDEQGSGATRAIAIGVATGALTFLVNRLLERWLR